MGPTGELFEPLGALTEAAAIESFGELAEGLKAGGDDFKPGQGIMVSRCNVRYTTGRIWGPGEPYSTSKALDNAVERRGDVAGCILHSDRGSQFRARKLHRALISRLKLMAAMNIG